LRFGFLRLRRRNPVRVTTLPSPPHSLAHIFRLRPPLPMPRAAPDGTKAVEVDARDLTLDEQAAAVLPNPANSSQ
jgi:hypothetical protein